jgi:hypothetical protein
MREAKIAVSLLCCFCGFGLLGFVIFLPDYLFVSGVLGYIVNLSLGILSLLIGTGILLVNSESFSKVVHPSLKKIPNTTPDRIFLRHGLSEKSIPQISSIIDSPRSR